MGVYRSNEGKCFVIFSSLKEFKNSQEYIYSDLRLLI